MTATEQADPELLGLALSALAQAEMSEERYDEAEQAIERARRIFAELGHQEGLHLTDELTGVARFHRGELDSALRYLTRSRDRYRELRGNFDAGWTLIRLARVQLAGGLVDDAETSAAEAVEDFRSRGDPRGLAAAYTCLAEAHAAANDTTEARLELEEALRLARRWSYPLETVDAETALQMLDPA